jgi:hypothetical protein
MKRAWVMFFGASLFFRIGARAESGNHAEDKLTPGQLKAVTQLIVAPALNVLDKTAAPVYSEFAAEAGAVDRARKSLVTAVLRQKNRKAGIKIDPGLVETNLRLMIRYARKRLVTPVGVRSYPDDRIFRKNALAASAKILAVAANVRPAGLCIPAAKDTPAAGPGTPERMRTEPGRKIAGEDVRPDGTADWPYEKEIRGVLADTVDGIIAGLPVTAARPGSAAAPGLPPPTEAEMKFLRAAKVGVHFSSEKLLR